MILCKNESIEKMRGWEDASTYVVTDFDRTLTIGKSESSWGILSHGDFVCDSYIQERQKYYDFYRPIEIDETMDFETKNKYMIDWWNKHIGLFVKYQLKEEIIKESIKDIHLMQFRKGALEMLESFHKRDIPVIIISAGIGNFITLFLQNHHCYYDNIYILSNFIRFENGVAVGMEDMVIHSLNKNEVSLPPSIAKKIKDRKHILLLGDNSSDVKMLASDKRKEALKIGFLEENVEENMSVFQEVYDIVCTEGTDFVSLAEQVPFLLHSEKR